MRTLLAIMVLIFLATTVNATCPANYIADCNLLAQTPCETSTYYSNITGVNKTCYWNVALCEENGMCDPIPSSSSSSSSSSSLASLPSTTTIATTTTTLVPGSCGVGEMQIEWSVIGLTESYQEECYYYANGTVLGCYGTNETICLPRDLDYYKISRPSTWDIIENPVGATTYILGLARPLVGVVFVLFVVFVILISFYKLINRGR